MSRSPLVRVGLTVLALLVLAPTAQAATRPSPTEFIANANVSDVAVDTQGRKYLAGSFTMVGPRVGRGLQLTTTDDQPDFDLPDFDGYVCCSFDDGNGG